MNFLRKLNLIDGIILFFIIILAIIYPLFFINFLTHPAEDAAILMRYSKNLAEGNGTVWNIGETPVDGATDFLFMVAVAFLYKVGIPLEISVLSIIYISHILTIIIVYVSIRTLYKGAQWMSSLSSIYLAIGPAFGYIGTYFGAPFFALFNDS